MIPTPSLSHLSKTDFHHVYEPAEDTFILLDALEADQNLITSLKPKICLEIGSGSGCVSTFLGTLISPQKPLIFCTDINRRANVATFQTGFHNGVLLHPIQTSLFTSLLPRLENAVDILIFNPPYVPTDFDELTFTQADQDIGGAWAGGQDGMVITNTVLSNLSTLLSPTGMFYLVAIAQNNPLQIIETVQRTQPGIIGESVLAQATFVNFPHPENAVPTMSTKKAKSKAEEALQFLDDLDSFSVVEAPPATSTPPPHSGTSTPAARASIDQSRKSTSSLRPSMSDIGRAGTATKLSAAPTTLDMQDKEAEDALAFLNEISQKKPSTPISNPLPAATIPTPTITAPAPAPAAAPAAAEQVNIPSASASTSGGGWGVGGWGVPTGLWGNANKAIQQAREVAEGQAKKMGVSVPTLAEMTINEETAKKWGVGNVMDYVKTANLEKLRHDLVSVSQHTLSNVLATIAPPISEHEVIEVWLSHDMIGYEGVEGVVFRGFSKIMEQVEGGELVVNRGKDLVPLPSKARDLNTVEGYDQAMKLAQANIDELVRIQSQKKADAAPVSTENPVTISPVFIRIQPVIAPLPFPEVAEGETAPNHLAFIIILTSPTHKISTTTLTQHVPNSWLDIEYEENEWVEDRLVEVLRCGVEAVAQQYIGIRMSIISRSTASAEVEVTVTEAKP